MGRPLRARAGLLAGLFAGLLGMACAPGAPPDAADSASSGAPARTEADRASGFTIEGREHYRILEITTGEEAFRIALVPRGRPMPDTKLPVIEVPVRRIATTSTTELPHLEALGRLDAWVGHADHRFVSSKALRARVESGAVAEIGGADGLGLDLERLLDLAPDLLLVDNPERAGADRLELLEAVGTRIVPMPSYRERSPLARAEWLKVTALFLGEEAEAERIFDEIAAHYEELRRRVEEKVAAGGARPTVMTGGPWQGVWHVAGGESFLARLLEDAGGRYLWAQAPGVGPLGLDIERVFERAGAADYWLYPSHWRSLREIEAADERLAGFEAFRSGQVYAADVRLTAEGGNDFWERGVHRPDEVLADLVAIFHPDLLPELRLVFHRRLERDAP